MAKVLLVMKMKHNTMLYDLLKKIVKERGYVGAIFYVKSLNIPESHRRAILNMLEREFHPFP